MEEGGHFFPRNVVFAYGPVAEQRAVFIDIYINIPWSLCGCVHTQRVPSWPPVRNILLHFISALPFRKQLLQRNLLLPFSCGSPGTTGFVGDVY